MEQYTTLEKGYPNPSFDSHPINPRELFDIPPHLRNQNVNFKVLDDDASDMKRTQLPPMHTLPDLNTGRFIAPFGHAMKKDGDAERMREIFGDRQVFGKREEEEPVEQKDIFGMQPMGIPAGGNNCLRGAVSQSASSADSFTPSYVPRMKVLEGDDPVRPVKDGFYYDPLSNPVNDARKQIYNAVLEYFPHFVMTKTSEVRGGNNLFSIFKAQIECLLCNGARYVVAIVKNDPTPIGGSKPLALIPWEAFQTRWITDDRELRVYKVKSFAYGRPMSGNILDTPIRLSRENKGAFIFTCDKLPLTVEVLKIKDDENIAESGTIASALELFQTIISFPN